MEPDQDPRVPAPRDGGRETAEDGGYPFLPFVPAPRVAPWIERMPVTAPLPTPVTAPVSTALVPAPVAPGAGLPALLRAWGRAVSRAVHAAVDGVRSLFDALVPAPAPR
ncbi:hypothetical protein [Actinomycetospora sp. NBC_00405]|uniref:hypothetical protein n=1 Tax=Actinomycetospora sp. NBC_00405 TaxID=2975952 RepID=UPI002E1A13E7